MYTGTNNHISIIKALYYNDKATCLDISKITGASIPNVAKNLNELIAAGYVIENGVASSNGGRKPIVYSLIKDKKYILSVAVDQFLTRMCIVDLHNNEVTTIHEFPLALAEDEDTALQLANGINAFIEGTNVPKSMIVGAGIAMPGFVNVEKGINRTFLKGSFFSLQEYLTQQTNLQVSIDNDSSVIALAELKFGMGKVKKELMVINIGWGIGLGMIINGEIFRGSTGFAGEFSHIPLFKNGKQCSCGKYGCLETEVSLLTIREKAIEKLASGQFALPLKGDDLPISAVLNAAAQGDSTAIGLITEAGYHLGQGISVLIHIMNPEVIVLSGKGIKAGKIWLAPIQQAINEFSIPTLTEETEVVLSPLGTNAQLIGAAALCIEKISASFFSENQIANNYLITQ